MPDADQVKDKKYATKEASEPDYLVALVDRRIGETDGQPYSRRRHPELVKPVQENVANAVRLGQRRAVHGLSVLEPSSGFFPYRAALDLQDEDAVSRRGDQEVGLGKFMPFSAKLE